MSKKIVQHGYVALINGRVLSIPRLHPTDDIDRWVDEPCLCHRCQKSFGRAVAKATLTVTIPNKKKARKK